MNTEQAISLLRMVLQWAGVFIVSKGWADDNTWIGVSGALLTLATAGFSLYARRNTGLVASAATVPGVSKIEATPKIADAVPSPKVQVGLSGL